MSLPEFSGHQTLDDWHAPCQSILFFIFMQFSAKMIPNDRLAPPVENPGSAEIKFSLFLMFLLKIEKLCRAGTPSRFTTCHDEFGELNETKEMFARGEVTD